jgi:hypothetical protein
MKSFRIIERSSGWINGVLKRNGNNIRIFRGIKWIERNLNIVVLISKKKLSDGGT